MLNNLRLERNRHNDSLINYERSASPKVHASRKRSHNFQSDPSQSILDRKAIVNNINSPK